MFKKIILALAVIFPMSVFAQKFGVVDVDNVFQAMPEAATMRTTLEEASKKYQSELQQLQQELDKLYSEFQTLNQDPATPESIKQRRLDDMQERNEKANQFASKAQQDLERLRQQLIEPIQVKVFDAIKTVGQEGDYTLVFPKAQDLLLYQGANVVDLTETVKAKLGIQQ